MTGISYLLKNTFGILLFVFGSIALFFIWLNFYTRHGESIKVPDFNDMEMIDAKAIAKSNKITLIVSDSIFMKGKKAGVVLSQNPKKGESVKAGRKVYLAVTKFTPDKVTLPKVFGVTEDYRQYSKKMKRLGISTKIKKEVYKRRLASGTILKVFYKGENISNKIEKEYKIPVGSTLFFEVSRSASNFVPVPDLACMSEDEATFLLEGSNLAVGNIKRLPGTQANNSYVISQKPFPGKTLHTGDKVSITVGSKTAAGCN